MSVDIFKKAAEIHNITHPNQPPVQEDFAEKMLVDLKGKSLESLMDKLNVLNELKRTPAGAPGSTLAFNQYYGDTSTSFILGQDDFHYIDRNGNPQVIHYVNRDKYFDDIAKVMIEKYQETQRLNTSAYAVINHIKYLTTQQTGPNPYPHIIYALVADPGKVNKVATADLKLAEFTRVMNLRSAEELLDALNPTNGALAQKYYNWLFNTTNVTTATANTAWNAYKAEYAKLRKASFSKVADQDLSNYVQNMAIGEALIGKLSLDRGWIGKLNANLLDVKGNFSVTDGNGKRTLDIDSFGNVNLDVTSLKISSKSAATQDYTNSLVNNAKNEVIEDTKTYTDTQINLVNGEILLKASKTEVSNAKDEAINTSNKYTDSAKDEAI
jgi:hypothetical protein